MPPINLSVLHLSSFTSTISGYLYFLLGSDLWMARLRSLNQSAPSENDPPAKRRKSEESEGPQGNYHPEANEVNTESPLHRIRDPLPDQSENLESYLVSSAGPHARGNGTHYPNFPAIDGPGDVSAAGISEGYIPGLSLAPYNLSTQGTFKLCLLSHHVSIQSNY